MLSHVRLISFDRDLFSICRRSGQLAFLFRAGGTGVCTSVSTVGLKIVLSDLLSGTIGFAPSNNDVQLSLFCHRRANLISVYMSSAKSKVPPQSVPCVFRHFFRSPRSNGGRNANVKLCLMGACARLRNKRVANIASRRKGKASIKLGVPIVTIRRRRVPTARRGGQLRSLPMLGPVRTRSRSRGFLSGVVHLVRSRLSRSRLGIGTLYRLSNVDGGRVCQGVGRLAKVSPMRCVGSVQVGGTTVLLRRGGFAITRMVCVINFSGRSCFSGYFRTRFKGAPGRCVRPTISRRGRGGWDAYK